MKKNFKEQFVKAIVNGNENLQNQYSDILSRRDKLLDEIREMKNHPNITKGDLKRLNKLEGELS